MKNTRLFSAAFAAAFLAALPARADWTLASGTQGADTTMSDGTHTLKVKVLDAANRTLRLGLQDPGTNTKQQSQATNGEKNGWELDFTSPIRLDGDSETWTIVEIGSYAFFNNKVISNPAGGLDLTSVTNIGIAAFMYCTGLTKANLSQDLRQVGNCAFTGANYITSYGTQFPDSLQIVRGGAFGRHTAYDSLAEKKVESPKFGGDVALLGIEEIYGNVFNDAPNVTSLTLGPNLAVLSASGTAIDNSKADRGPFSGMGGLTNVTFQGPAPTAKLPATLFSSYYYGGKDNNLLDSGARTLVVRLTTEHAEGWVTAFQQIGTVTETTLDADPDVFARFDTTATGSAGNGSTTVYLARPPIVYETPVAQWTGESGETPGLKSVSYVHAVFGGRVVACGPEAAACAAECKVWADGAEEPADWTRLADGLVRNAPISAPVTGLASGTRYRYALRLVGDDGTVSEVAEGAFTTLGRPGDTFGSPDTHLFVTDEDAYYVANDFERYLRFEVVGYSGTETLTNFPVLVDVRKKDANGFKYEDFYLKNGQDMVFVDDHGRLIPHEIDTWNENGMSAVWVRLPEMVNGTKFTMCYRSPMVTPLSERGNTFEKYVGVWHLNERGNGVVDVRDSTENHLDGETHAASLEYTSGWIGRARRVAQRSGSAATYGRILIFEKDGILDSVGNVFTYSGWYKTVNSSPDYAYLVSRKAEDQDVGWGLQFNNNDTGNMRVWSGLGRTAAGQEMHTSTKISGYGHTKWAYFTFVYSNDVFNAYVNGDKVQSDLTLKQAVVNDEGSTYRNLVIGGMQSGYSAFNGYVDEARYSKGVRSPDWIRAEYDSNRQLQNFTFVKKADEVGRGPESLVPVVVWEQGRGLPNTVLDVSYAYVQFAGTVTYCGAGADECRVEYKLWADGEAEPAAWTTLRDRLAAGDAFSIPIWGLKQDMPYHFEIRAVNEVDGEQRHNRAQSGSFRTPGNVSGVVSGGELLRVANRFVHRFPAGEWTFTTPDYVTNVEIMVVGGGGAGGYKMGGGGGGGGLWYGQSYPVATNTTYVVNVGRGGRAATNLLERSENGEWSYFSLESDREHPLVAVPGGGSGGSFNETDATIAAGGDGGSGGGGTYAQSGGGPVEDGAFGTSGGAGNNITHGQTAAMYTKSAAGGGGGAGRAGLAATSDNPPSGGSGGVGVGNDMTGEMLYYGAGGGGGSRRYFSTTSYSGAGGGGSGIGGDAADIGNNRVATSGVPNTGAGGGGGSYCWPGAANTNKVNNADDPEMLWMKDEKFWQGGDGGDGVVLIAYEVHGRDPISDDPRITMTSCLYDQDAMLADIGYRAYWAGIQADTNELYVLYSTVSSNAVAAGEGDLFKAKSGQIGIGSLEFPPPEVGYTYWVRLVARKEANSFMYSDEIASFHVPAVSLQDAVWKKQNKPQDDFAEVSYRLYDTAPETHLYCYWSQARASLEGDGVPSGDGVHLFDLGTGQASATTFNLPASEGLKRNEVYYLRLAASDEKGLRHFLSDEIAELRTIDQPAVAFTAHEWSPHVASVKFKTTLSTLDPADTTLYALYSTVAGDVKDGNAPAKESVRLASLGLCSGLPDDVDSWASFPLYASEPTNYYVRLALYSATQNKYWLSGSTRTIAVTQALPTNTLLIVATARPMKVCYGDEPPPLDYAVSYAGFLDGPDGPSWTHQPDVVGAPACAATAASAPGVYEIAQGTLALSSPEPYEEIVEDPDTGESRTIVYYYLLSYAGARYAVTNAALSATVADATFDYTGESHAGEVAPVVTGVRNGRTVTVEYRVGAGEWSAEPPAFTDAGVYSVQFRATAPNHDGDGGTFKVTVNPAPLGATISAQNLAYTGAAQAPAVATNVTGLVRGDLNPLACAFRDEAGEWQATVPAFTTPGEYVLYFKAEAPNHETAVASCTVTVEGWDYRVNLDGQTDYPTPIFVTDPGWLLKQTGRPAPDFAQAEDRYAILDAVCPNGLKLWQNYVIQREDLSRKLAAAVLQAGSRVPDGAFVVRFPDVQALRNTGLAVGFRLDRRLRGEGAFAEGEVTDKYETAVPLAPGDPTGLYVFNMVLTPTNELYKGHAVLSSIATVGVLRVTSPCTNVVTATPWRSAATDAAEAAAATAAEAVNPNGLAAGDRILAYDSSTGLFHTWTHETGVSWKAIATASAEGVSVVAADEAPFAPGSAFWLVRSNPAAGAFYLVGRATGEDYAIPLSGGSEDEPGYTLVANPTMSDVNLNDLAFVGGAPAAGDRIVIQDSAGYQRVYIRRGDAWGRWVSRKIGGRVKQEWVADATVPSGTGFWYVRTASGDLSIRFEGAK